MAKRITVIVLMLWALSVYSVEAHQVNIQFQDTAAGVVVPDTVIVIIANEGGLRVASELFAGAQDATLVFSGIPGDFIVVGKPEDSMVNFSDFLLFAQYFQFRETIPSWHRGNINGQNGIDFGDFIAFAQYFNVHAIDLPKTMAFTVEVRSTKDGIITTTSSVVTLQSGEGVNIDMVVKTTDIFSETLRIALSDSVATVGDTIRVPVVRTLYRNGVVARIDSLDSSLFTMLVTSASGETLANDKGAFIASVPDTLLISVDADTLSARDTIVVLPKYVPQEYETLRIAFRDSVVTVDDTVRVSVVRTMYRDNAIVRIDSLDSSLFTMLVTSASGETLANDGRNFLASIAGTMYVHVDADTLSAIDSVLAQPKPVAQAPVVRTFRMLPDHSRIDSLMLSEKVLLTIRLNSDVIWGPTPTLSIQGMPIQKLHEGTNVLLVTMVDAAGNSTDTTFAVVEPDRSGPEIIGVVSGVYGTMDGPQLTFSFSMVDSFSGLGSVGIREEGGDVFYAASYSGEKSAHVDFSHQFGTVGAETARNIVITAIDGSGFETSVSQTFYQAPSQTGGGTTPSTDNGNGNGNNGGDDGGTPPPSPSPQPTLDSLIGPATLSAGQTGQVTASATNATRIEWFVDGTATGATGSSYSFSSLSVGNHIVTARAINNSGSDTKTAEKSVTIFVGGGAP